MKRNSSQASTQLYIALHTAKLGWCLTSVLTCTQQRLAKIWSSSAVDIRATCSCSLHNNLYSPSNNVVLCKFIHIISSTLTARNPWLPLSSQFHSVAWSCHADAILLLSDRFVHANLRSYIYQNQVSRKCQRGIPQRWKWGPDKMALPLPIKAFLQSTPDASQPHSQATWE